MALGRMQEAPRKALSFLGVNFKPALPGVGVFVISCTYLFRALLASPTPEHDPSLLLFVLLRPVGLYASVSNVMNEVCRSWGARLSVSRRWALPPEENDPRSLFSKFFDF